MHLGLYIDDFEMTDPAVPVQLTRGVVKQVRTLISEGVEDLSAPAYPSLTVSRDYTYVYIYTGFGNRSANLATRLVHIRAKVHTFHYSFPVPIIAIVGRSAYPLKRILWTGFSLTKRQKPIATFQNLIRRAWIQPRTAPLWQLG